MTPLEAAQSLERQVQEQRQWSGHRICPFCGGWMDSDHAVCPLLELPRIRAALEAVERVIEANDIPDCGETFDQEWNALVAALRSDEVTA